MPVRNYASPDEYAIENGELCPKCGKPLIYRRYDRVNKNRTVTPSQQFLGCSGWPNCGFTKKLSKRDIEEDETFHRTPRPEDIDFPCSYTWRAYYEEMATGQPLPNIDQPVLEPKTDQVEPPQVENIPEYLKDIYKRLEHEQAINRYLLNKVKELQVKKKWNSEGIF